jgi:hypothetical protein
LKGGGITDAVIAVMVERCNSSSRAQGTEVSAADPAGVHAAGIYVMENWRQPAQRQIIRPSKAGALKVTGNGSIFFPRVGNSPCPEAPATMRSGRRNRASIFNFNFKVDDRMVSDFGTATSVAAQSPDKFTLVRFRIKGEERDINAGRVSAYQGRLGSDPKDAIAFHAEEIGDGIFKVAADQPFVAGQYAFALACFRNDRPQSLGCPGATPGSLAGCGAGTSVSGAGGLISGGGTSGCAGWLGCGGASGGGVVAMSVLLHR